MFIGRFYHTLETSGRIQLPKTFRNQEQNWVITRGLDGGLFLFRREDFATQIQELAERTFTHKKNRDFIRLMVNSAEEVSPDKIGRVLVPEYLRELAQLHKKIVVVGSYSYLEIWNQELYHNYLEALAPQAAAIAESLNENT